MSPRMNELGQPLGDPVPDWTRRPWPPRTPMAGRLVRLEPLDAAKHSQALFDAFAADTDNRIWTYLPDEPPRSAEDLRARFEAHAGQDDPVLYTILDASGRALGYSALMRIDPEMGSVEIGHVVFSPALQRTALATEAMYLLMKRAFDELGYRRYEWKCDALNAASLAAAERLGFRYEGTFRQAVVRKGRNRDTAWLSIIDSEWPAIKSALEAWLEPSNFDASGRQLQRLQDIMRATGR